MLKCLKFNILAFKNTNLAQSLGVTAAPSRHSGVSRQVGNLNVTIGFNQDATRYNNLPEIDAQNLIEFKKTFSCEYSDQLFFIVSFFNKKNSLSSYTYFFNI